MAGKQMKRTALAIALLTSLSASAATITIVGNDGIQQIEYSSIVIDRNGNVTVVLSAQQRLDVPQSSVIPADNRAIAPIPKPW